MQSTVRWGETEFKLEGCAVNGEEALRLLRVNNYDIVLTDLNMPGMDGFDLIMEIEKNYKNTLVLVLSVYSDFVSIRKAFQLGAKDYILKYEIEHDYVLKALRGAIVKTQMQDETRLIQRQFEHVLGGGGEDYLLKQRCSGKEMVILLCKLIEKNENNGEWTKSSEEVQEVLSRELMFEYPDSCLIKYEGSLVLLITLAHGVVSEKRLQERLENLAFRLRECAFGIGFVNVFSGISNHFRDVGQIEKQYKLAKKRLTGVFLYDKRLLFSEDIHAGELVLPDIRKIVKQMVAGIHDGEPGTVKSVLEQLEREIRRQGVPNREAIIIYLIRVLSLTKAQLVEKDIRELKMLNMAESVCNSLMGVKTLRDGVNILKEFMIRLAGEYKDRGIRKEERMIRKAVEYMEEHYNEELSLSTVSGELDISPNYFSSLFMKRMQRSFSAYLTDIRMKHAKELLISSDKRIYEIARECGYPSVENFSRSFKKAVGTSPAHYKECKVKQ